MDHYGKARREGLRAYTAEVQAHRNPYLPVLEDREPNLEKLNRRNLGVQNVPLERVTGSVSQGRSYAFACNFMPILEGGSEFAAKWEHLYASVEEEGMNQPVTLLEYMGFYYVTEGNKRVSVMKSMGALDIEADVTRVVLPRSGSPELEVYADYCDFARDTGIYTLLFTRPGSYQKLLSLPGVRAGETWTEEEILSLRKAFNAFRTAYAAQNGEKKPMLTGDAFLSYLVTFDYREILEDDSRKTAERVRLMNPELTARDRVQLVMEAAPGTPQGNVGSLLATLFRPSKVRAAFLYSRPPEESAWEYWHELGRLELESKLGARVETLVRVIPSRDRFREEVEPLIREGCAAIFATTPEMMNSCVEPALKHPDVRFYCCSLLSGASSIQTYYSRFYEAKFLLGLAAGILARNGKIGYIADYPIFGAPSAVNAFALGARMVNPEAKIYMNWSSAVFFDPDCPFIDPEIQVICNRDITSPMHGSREVGLHLRTADGITNIATLIPRWGPFYRAIVEKQLSGGAQNKSAATNLWWGMGSDVLDVAFSDRFDRYALRMVNGFRDAIRGGAFSPFEGTLRDQEGNLRCGPERRLTPAEILCMDYLLDNVVGSLPTLEELSAQARPLVKLQGIHGELKPQLASFSW